MDEVSIWDFLLIVVFTIIVVVTSTAMVNSRKHRQSELEESEQHVSHLEDLLAKAQQQTDSSTE